MKKIFIAVCIILYAVTVNAALVVRDDFNRADTTAITDATHRWVERQSKGEASIVINKLEIAIVNGSGSSIASNSIFWFGDSCSLRDNGDSCTIKVTINLKSTSTGNNSGGYGNGIIVLGRGISDFTTVTGLTLVKGMSGTVTLRNTLGTTATWATGVSRIKDDAIGDKVQATVYNSNGNILLDACWGIPGGSDPCAGWVLTGYNLTSNSFIDGAVSIKSREVWNTGVTTYDNGTSVTNYWWFEDWSFDVQNKLMYKPWLSGLASTGVSVHAKPNDGGNNIAIQYGTSSTLTSYTETSGTAPDGENNLIVRKDITGLSANTKYYYRVKSGTWVDSNIYSFTTLPTIGTASNFRFAVIGCTQWLSGETSAPVFSVLQSLNPQFIIATGDNGYGDPTDRHHYYTRWNYLWTYPEYQSLLANTPIYAVYNDHDGGGKDDGYGAGEYINYVTGTINVQNGSTAVTGTSTVWNATNIPRTGNATTNIALKIGTDPNLYPHLYSVTINTDTTLTLAYPFHEVTNASATYQLTKATYWANQVYPLYYNNTGIVTGDSTYYTFEVGRVKFYGTNQIQYGSDPSAVDDANKVMMGSTQLDWLRTTYQIDTNPMKFLIFGEPLWTDRNLNGSYKYSAYTFERNALHGILGDATGSSVILSGDSHLMMWGNPENNPNVLEINTSRTLNTPGGPFIPEHKNGWWYDDSTTASEGFAIVDVTDDGTDVTAKMTFYNYDGSILNTVSWGTDNTRAIVCSYDATKCPQGRQVK